MKSRRAFSTTPDRHMFMAMRLCRFSKNMLETKMRSTSKSAVTHATEDHKKFFNINPSKLLPMAMATSCGGLGGIFERYAHVQPESPAVLDPEGQWSYQDSEDQLLGVSPDASFGGFTFHTSSMFKNHQELLCSVW